MNKTKRDLKDWLPPLKEILGDEGKAAEVLSFIEEQESKEKERRKKVQKEGIQMAREKGVSLGRPRKHLPDNYESIYEGFFSGDITAEQAAKYCGVGLSTFYRKVKSYRKEHKVSFGTDQ